MLHDRLRLPSEVAKSDDETRELGADRNLPSSSCLKIKIAYGNGFLNQYGSETAATAAVIQLVKDANIRFKSGNYPGLNTDITLDVLESKSVI